MKNKKLTINGQFMLNNEKNLLFTVTFISLLIAHFSLLTGCRNPFEPHFQNGNDAGTACLSLAVSVPGGARAIVPLTVQDDFAKYRFEFVKGIDDADNFVAELDASDLPLTIALKAGAWTVTASAFLPGKTAPSARGTLAVAVPSEGTIFGSIALSPLAEGSGAFAWDITFDESIAAARMIITLLDENFTETEDAAVLHFIHDTEQTVPADGSCTLASGCYRVVFHLENDEGKTASRREILYVYDGMESKYAGAFSESLFLTPAADAIKAWLLAQDGGSTAGDPVYVPLQIPLGVMTDAASGWQQLLNAIAGAGKFVDLDLSACFMTETEFNPDCNEVTGKDKIAGITLPDEAEGIGNYAFYGCTSLERIAFPAATVVQDGAFIGCTALASFDLIGTGHLSVIENGKALVRNSTDLICYPTASGSIILNDIINIENHAFYACASLTDIGFPEAESVGDYAFDGCTSLAYANFPSVRSIGQYAFANTGTCDLIFILNNAVPEPGTDIFAGFTSPKNITVIVPSGATSYGAIPTVYSGADATPNWGNAFRGMGWDGSDYLNGTVNSNINLFIIDDSGVFTVTFNANGGDSEADPHLMSFVPPSTSLGSLPVPPTRDHYYFAGWNSQADGSGTSFIAGTSVSGNTTVFAQWTGATYTVAFNNNGGDTEASPNTKTVTYPVSNTDNLPEPPTREHYTFTGWNTRENGSGTSFTASTTVVGNNTVYAQWTGVTYTVAFNNNGGDTEASPNTKTATYPAANIGSLPAPPIREDYYFFGWNTATDGLGTAFTAGTTVTGNTVVYAQWVDCAEMEMVWVPGGSFQLGKEIGTADYADFTPISTVTLTGFYMGKYEVTQGQYQAVMGGNPSYFASDPASGETQSKRPVEGVSWYDALVFCNKLSMMEGKTPAYSISGSTDPAAWGTVPTSSDSTWNSVAIVSGSTGYRLPTEAQWEYAAKGGASPSGSYTYSGSNDLNAVAWYWENSGDKTHEVGKKAANGLGLYDMSGNVFEWCWDWYGDYTSAAKADPLGVSSYIVRVIRGGSWIYNAQLRSVYRGVKYPYYRDDAYPLDQYGSIGFRVSLPDLSAPPIIAITAHPATLTNVTAGIISGSLTAAAIATKDAAPGYQWYSNTSAVTTGGTLLPGKTGANFTIPAELTMGTYYYFCEVSAPGAASVRTGVATVIVTNQTPVAGDYTIGNLSQTAGSVTAVAITPKSGKSPGTVSNVRYSGSTTEPQTAGTYAVTFDVTAATGWNTASNLSAGNLVVTNQTPIAGDYTIGNLSQTAGSVTAVTITANSGKSPGAVRNIRYSGSTTTLQTEGTYAVFFDVEAATYWNAAADLFAGDLVVANQTPIASDYTIGNLNQTAGSVIAVTITANIGKSPGTVSNIRYGGSTTVPQTAGTYAVTFDVTVATYWSAASNLSAGNLVVNPLTSPKGIELVWVPAGTFTMGSPDTEPSHQSNETQHQVTLTTGFYMGKYQITQGQYETVMEVLPSSISSSYGKGANYPVYYVSWYEAIVFCNKLSMMEGLIPPAYSIDGDTDPEEWVKKHGAVPTSWNSTSRWNYAVIVPESKGYRLPTEAQWEYACRAGTATAYNWGCNYINDTKANYYASYVDNANNLTAGTSLSRTTNVGSYAPNAWGLYDMHGNVWEWCWDWHGSYTSSAVDDPTDRVIRGGSWDSYGRSLRSAHRGNSYPSRRFSFIGFRVVCP